MITTGMAGLQSMVHRSCLVLALVLSLVMSVSFVGTSAMSMPPVSDSPSGDAVLPPPYPTDSGHGPQDNSIDRVLEIMRRHHGPRRQIQDPISPFEEFPVHNDPNETAQTDPALTHDFLAEQTLWDSTRGHVYTLNNTLRHFSILEPHGGCERRRVPTSVTSKASHCVLATNAGFFNTRTGACLGNLVANQSVVQSPGTKNVNFGITHDGKYVVGYLDSEDVFNTTTGESRFQQLIAGVIWLVRDGQNYVSVSKEIEDMSTQETGPSFTTVKAPRLALGHDADGRLMLVSVDALGLEPLADLLISMGVKNAINLDGGGSVSVWDHDVMVNYPTDQCNPPRGRSRCERAVTTVTCIHRLDFADGLPHCDSPNDESDDEEGPLVLSIEHIFAAIVFYFATIVVTTTLSTMLGIWIGNRRSNSRFTALKDQYEMAQLDEFDVDDAQALQPSTIGAGPAKKVVRISRDPPMVLEDNNEL